MVTDHVPTVPAFGVADWEEGEEEEEPPKRQNARRGRKRFRVRVFTRIRFIEMSMRPRRVHTVAP